MRQDIRSSDVFLKLDLANMLIAQLGSVEGMAAAVPASGQAAAYAAGYRAAIVAALVSIGATEHAHAVSTRNARELAALLEAR